MTEHTSKQSRWDSLEADLDSQAEAEQQSEHDAEVADRTRAQRGLIALSDRLRAAPGPVAVTLSDGSCVAGRVSDLGSAWFVLQGPGTVQTLIREAAIVSASGLARAALPESAGRIDPARPLAAIIRRWARDRHAVVVQLTTGSPVAGVLAAAYADHLDLMTEAGRLTIPYAALTMVVTR